MNYLQRIAISGSRATSTAKPPASAQALIPPISSSIRSSMHEDMPRAAEDFSEPGMFEMQATHEEPVQAQTNKSAPLEKSIVESITPSHDEFPAEPDTFGTKVLAPKGLRRVRADNDQQQEMTRAVGETQRPVSPGQPKIRVEHEAFEQLQDKPSAISPTPVNAKSHVLHISARANQSKGQESAVHAGEDGVPVQILPAATRHNVEVNPSPRLAEKQMAVEPGLFEAQPTRFKQSARPPVSGASDKRRLSQISIGKIDVQVNNLPAVEATNQPQARQPTRSNFLEARCLDRFFLKL